MTLTTDETIRLGKLKSAYDKLLMGRMVEEVESNGERMKFVRPTEANIQRLKTEIETLEAKAAGTTRRARGGITFSL